MSLATRGKNDNGGVLWHDSYACGKLSFAGDYLLIRRHIVFFKRHRLLKKLRRAIDLDHVSHCMIVAEASDEADRLIAKGKKQAARQLLEVIASLDIDDKLLEMAVDRARAILEADGVPCEPSIHAEYATYLKSLPAHQRHVMLARQCLREMASGIEPEKKAGLRRQALQHFEDAVATAPLSERDHKIYLGLKGSD